MATTRVLAVTSGKGGVGKSVVALNLAVALARHGQRVLLVDADLGLGAVGILLGISPEYTLEDLLQGRCRLEEVVAKGPEEISILPAAAEGDAAFWVEAELSQRVAEELREFEADFDFVLVDTGAGIGVATVDFVAAAGEALLLVTPEPTAIADAYATLKVLLGRQPTLRPGLLVNMADSTSEAAMLHQKFRELVRRFLGAEIDNRGYIPLDRYVREAVKRQMPFVLAMPPSPAAEAVAEIASQFVQEKGIGRVEPLGLFLQALQQRQRSLGGKEGRSS